MRNATLVLLLILIICIAAVAVFAFLQNKKCGYWICAGKKWCGDEICNNGERWKDCPEDCAETFVNFNQPSGDFDLLIKDIGIATSQTQDKEEIIARLQEILRWLAIHRTEPGDAGGECSKYSEKIQDYDGWKSPEILGKTFKKFGVVCPGTCFSTAYTFALLAYKSGIPESDFQMVGRHITKNNELQHWWTRLKLDNGEWLQIDPLCAEENTTLSLESDLLCNRPDIYHPCEYITPSESKVFDTTSWHCIND